MILQDSDENYGDKDYPLCKKCKGLSRVTRNRKSVKDFSLLSLVFLFGVSSISVYIFSGEIWPDKLFHMVGGFIYGTLMGIAGTTISLIQLFSPDTKKIRAFIVIAILLNFSMPLFFIGLMVFRNWSEH